LSGKFSFATVGEFYGDDLTDFEAEKLQIGRYAAQPRVFKKHFAKELALYQTKWFDYRLLHPVVATYLYAAEFRRIYKRYYSKTIDLHKSRYIRGFSGQDAWVAKASNGFIKGRQQADSMGIPYWFYISNAYEWLYIKKWKHLPRHVHLYNQEVIDFVEMKWGEQNRGSLIIAELDFFKDYSNSKRPEFIAHQEWLVERISKSRAKQAAIESLNERGYFI